MIKADALTKDYGPLRAVDGISFAVQPGEVLGFLGPNGAGKTTTMRMLAGFITPSAGRAEICGYRIDRQPIAAKSSFGYLPEGAPAYSEMHPGEFLEFVARARGLAGARRRERLDAVISQLHLERVLYQPIDTLSKGFKRRVGLAQAIIHDPPVLILDEPTDGLDPNQKHEVRELIRNVSPEKAIVISTHILEEVDAVCNRAIIIADGRIVADETPEALINRSRFHNAVTLKFRRGADMEAVAAALRNVPGVADVELNEASRRVTAVPREDAVLLPEISALAGREQWQLEQLHLESGRLDEVFRSITQPGAGA